MYYTEMPQSFKRGKENTEKAERVLPLSEDSREILGITSIKFL